MRGPDRIRWAAFFSVALVGLVGFVGCLVAYLLGRGLAWAVASLAFYITARVCIEMAERIVKRYSVRP